MKKTKAEIAEALNQTEKALTITRQTANSQKSELEILGRELKALEESLRGERDYNHQLQSRNNTLCYRLSSRLEQLRQMRNNLSQYLAAKEVGAPTIEVENLRVDAHRSLVELMGVDLNEPILQEASNVCGVGEQGLQRAMCASEPGLHKNTRKSYAQL